MYPKAFKSTLSYCNCKKKKVNVNQIFLSNKDNFFLVMLHIEILTPSSDLVQRRMNKKLKLLVKPLSGIKSNSRPRKQINHFLFIKKQKCTPRAKIKYKRLASESSRQVILYLSKPFYWPSVYQTRELCCAQKLFSF